jgi:hypothetical protein
MRKANQISGLVLLISLLPAGTVSAADNLQDREIEQLLGFVGNSGCDFIRNGKRHESGEAESHLRMKYSKARRYIDDAQDFIDRIASESSWSGKPYQVQCPEQPPRNSGPWLHAALQDIRTAEAAETN